jgi:DNA-directed RNA polymerase subunit beta'
MTSKVSIKDSGDTPLTSGELINLSLIRQIHNVLNNNSTETIFKTPQYEPVLMSTTNSSLNKDGFLSAAGFQETKRMLSKAAIEGTTDWLRGLKESIIIGRMIPAGSAFLNYKSYLDNIYLFKNKSK